MARVAHHGRNAPALLIKADFLLDARLADYAGTLPAGAFMAGQGNAGNVPKVRRSATCWREHDLQRAIAVARRAGLKHYRVEITPDGAMTLVVGEPAGKPRRK